MKKYIIAFYVLVFLNSLDISAQDAIWSDYFATPFALSPALTGVMQGNDRFSASMRSQWGSVLKENAYKTKSVSYDRRWCGNIPLATGLRVSRDQAGSSNFTRNEAYLSAAFYQHLGNKGGYLIAGAEGGFLQNSVSLNGYSFDTQFNGQDYIASADNGETGLSGNAYLWDFGAGISWINPQSNYYWIVGASLHHINTPNYSFGESINNVPTDAEIPMRAALHASAHFRNSKRSRFGFQPRAIFQQQRKHWQAVIGVDFDYFVDSSRSFPVGIGAAWRMGGQFDNLAPHSDALLLSIRLGTSTLSAIALTYDLNISKLRKASYGAGSFELTITHQLTKNIKKQCTECHFFRWFEEKSF